MKNIIPALLINGLQATQGQEPFINNIPQVAISSPATAPTYKPLSMAPTTTAESLEDKEDKEEEAQQVQQMEQQDQQTHRLQQELQQTFQQNHGNQGLAPEQQHREEEETRLTEEREIRCQNLEEMSQRIPTLKNLLETKAKEHKQRLENLKKHFNIFYQKPADSDKFYFNDYTEEALHTYTQTLKNMDKNINHFQERTECIQMQDPQDPSTKSLADIQNFIENCETDLAQAEACNIFFKMHDEINLIYHQLKKTARFTNNRKLIRSLTIMAHSSNNSDIRIIGDHMSLSSYKSFMELYGQDYDALAILTAQEELLINFMEKIIPKKKELTEEISKIKRSCYKDSQKKKNLREAFYKETLDDFQEKCNDFVKDFQEKNPSQKKPPEDMSSAESRKINIMYTNIYSHHYHRVFKSLKEAM